MPHSSRVDVLKFTTSSINPDLAKKSKVNRIRISICGKFLHKFYELNFVAIFERLPFYWLQPGSIIRLAASKVTQPIFLNISTFDAFRWTDSSRVFSLTLFCGYHTVEQYSKWDNTSEEYNVRKGEYPKLLHVRHMRPNILRALATVISTCVDQLSFESKVTPSIRDLLTTGISTPAYVYLVVPGWRLWDTRIMQLFSTFTLIWFSSDQLSSKLRSFCRWLLDALSLILATRVRSSAYETLNNLSCAFRSFTYIKKRTGKGLCLEARQLQLADLKVC